MVFSTPFICSCPRVPRKLHAIFGGPGDRGGKTTRVFSTCLFFFSQTSKFKRATRHSGGAGEKFGRLASSFTLFFSRSPENHMRFSGDRGNRSVNGSVKNSCLPFRLEERKVDIFTDPFMGREKSVEDLFFFLEERSKIFLPEKKNRRFFFSTSVVENRRGPPSPIAPPKIARNFRGRDPASALLSDISPDSDTFYYSWSFFFQKKDGFSPNSRFFFLCPAGAEGKKSCLSFRFLWNRKNGRPLRFLWNLRGPGVGGNIGIVKNSPFFPYGKKGPGVGENPSFFFQKKDPRLPSKIACDFRRQTAGPFRFRVPSDSFGI